MHQGQESSIQPNDPVLKDAIQKLVGDITLIRGKFTNLNFPTSPGWRFNADGSYELIGGGVTAAHYSTCFEDSGRFTNTNDGTGTNVFGTAGVVLTTTANANGWAKTTWDIGSSNAYLFASDPVFSASLYINTFGFDNQQMFVGVGSPTSNSGAAGITFTDASFGFKLIRESGIINVYATNGSGSASTATLLTSIGASGGDHLELIAKLHSDESIDYFYRVDGGALSSVTTQSTNLPPSSTAATVCSIITNNHNVAQIMTLTGLSMYYSR